MTNKILIADDSKLVLTLVKSIFENEKGNYIVISASDGKEAIEKAEKENPDIILMDWQMPEMSGLEALKILKQNEKTSSIPVIMLTASESTLEAFEAGASDFVQKPFNKNELIARVRSSIELVNIQKELKIKNIDLEIQNNKLKLQKDILVKQKKEIAEFLDIGLKVSNLFIPSETALNHFFESHFLLSIPADVVTSNFLWITKRKETVFFCMGFMRKNIARNIFLSSGILNMLNNIVDKAIDINIDPSMVLKQLSEVFKEDSSENNVFKCCDIIFCAIDPVKKSMQYSGINVPLFIVKNNKIVELKTNQKTEVNISKYEFTNHKIQLAKEDVIYILNDGFNEFKASFDDKATISNEIIDLLQKVYKKELNKQKILFDKTFQSWKKELKQINDIMVLGIKI
jgi:CheY-like chemotaxis protein